MASGKPFYGGEVATGRVRGEMIGAPKIKDMAPFDELSSQPVPILDPMEMLLLPTPSKAVHQKEESDDSKSYADGGGVTLGAPRSPIAGDPQLPQLSSNYWNRVRQQDAMRRATQPSADQRQALDAKAQGQNALLSPPGPQPDTAPGAAYAKGGKVKSFGFAKGGSSKGFTKDYRK